MDSDIKAKTPDTANIRGSKSSNFNDLKDQYRPKSTRNSPSTEENLRNFRQFIIENIGYAPDHIGLTGKLERFSSNGKKVDLSGWYVFFVERDFAAGAFGCWRKGHKYTWNSHNGSGRLPEKEWRRISSAIADAQRKTKIERAHKAKQAQQKAIAMWGAADEPFSEHNYLIRKQVGAHGIRQSGEQLLIPLCDLDGVLYSVQTIAPDGTKRFLSGTPKRGKFCLIGNRLVHSGGVYLCEGYATGASLYETYQRPVLVAFDSGNLLPVARAYREKFPHIPLTVCADNDRKTEGNPGLTKAREVCTVFPDVGLIVPEFPDDAPGNFSDFNDLTALLGSRATQEYNL